MIARLKRGGRRRRGGRLEHRGDKRANTGTVRQQDHRSAGRNPVLRLGIADHRVLNIIGLDIFRQLDERKHIFERQIGLGEIILAGPQRRYLREHVDAQGLILNGDQHLLLAFHAPKIIVDVASASVVQRLLPVHVLDALLDNQWLVAIRVIGKGRVVQVTRDIVVRPPSASTKRRKPTKLMRA